MTDTGTLGSGRFTYQVVVEWEDLPPGYSWTDAAAVAVDSSDRVYVFNRGDHPMIVFDSDGRFLSSWGEDVFSRAHGLTIGPDDMLYCTDDGDHTVRKCTPEGKVLMTIGTPDHPAEPYSGKPFNRCTDVALDPQTGDLYVSDGYVNARVHKYSPDGKLLFSWGEPGTDPGEFNIVHNIATDKDGYVYVADRRATGCRCSTATASTRPSGTISTGRAPFTCLMPRRSTSASSDGHAGQPEPPQYRAENHRPEHQRRAPRPYRRHGVRLRSGPVCSAPQPVPGL